GGARSAQALSPNKTSNSKTRTADGRPRSRLLGLDLFIFLVFFLVLLEIFVEALEHRGVDILVGDGFIVVDGRLFLLLGDLLLDLLFLVLVLVLDQLVGIGRQLLDVVVLFLILVVAGAERGGV